MSSSSSASEKVPVSSRSGFKRSGPSLREILHISKILKTDEFLDYTKKQAQLRTQFSKDNRLPDYADQMTLEIWYYIRENKEKDWSAMEKPVAKFLSGWLEDCEKKKMEEAYLVRRLCQENDRVLIQDISYIIDESRKFVGKLDILKKDYLRSVFPKSMDVIYPLEESSDNETADDDRASNRNQEKDRNGQDANSHANESETDSEEESITTDDDEDSMNGLKDDSSVSIQDKCTESICSWFVRQERIRNLPIEFDDHLEYTNIEKQILNIWREHCEEFKRLTEEERRSSQREVFEVVQNQMKVGYLKKNTLYPLAYDTAYYLLQLVNDETLQFDAFAIKKLTEKTSLDENQVLGLYEDYLHTVFRKEDFAHEEKNDQEKDKNAKNESSEVNESETDSDEESITTDDNEDSMDGLKDDSSVSIQDKCTESICSWFVRQERIRNLRIEFDDNPVYTNIEKQILKIWREHLYDFAKLTEEERRNSQREVFEVVQNQMKVGYLKNNKFYPPAYDTAYYLLQLVNNETLQFDAFAMKELTEKTSLDENQVLGLYEDYFHAVFKKDDFANEEDHHDQEKDKNGTNENSHVNDGSENGGDKESINTPDNVEVPKNDFMSEEI